MDGSVLQLTVQDGQPAHLRITRILGPPSDGSPVVIGRASSYHGDHDSKPAVNNGLFFNKIMSKVHAEIEWLDGVVPMLKDLSQHGTYIVTPSEAEAGTVKFGKVEKKRRLEKDRHYPIEHGSSIIFGKVIEHDLGDSRPDGSLSRIYYPIRVSCALIDPEEAEAALEEHERSESPVPAPIRSTVSYGLKESDMYASGPASVAGDVPVDPEDEDTDETPPDNDDAEENWPTFESVYDLTGGAVRAVRLAPHQEDDVESASASDHDDLQSIDSIGQGQPEDPNDDEADPFVGEGPLIAEDPFISEAPSVDGVPFADPLTDEDEPVDRVAGLVADELMSSLASPPRLEMRQRVTMVTTEDGDTGFALSGLYTSDEEDDQGEPSNSYQRLHSPTEPGLRAHSPPAAKDASDQEEEEELELELDSDSDSDDEGVLGASTFGPAGFAPELSPVEDEEEVERPIAPLPYRRTRSPSLCANVVQVAKEDLERSERQASRCASPGVEVAEGEGLSGLEELDPAAKIVSVVEEHSISIELRSTQTTPPRSPSPVDKAELDAATASYLVTPESAYAPSLARDIPSSPRESDPTTPSSSGSRKRSLSTLEADDDQVIVIEDSVEIVSQIKTVAVEARPVVKKRRLSSIVGSVAKKTAIGFGAYCAILATCSVIADAMD